MVKMFNDWDEILKDEFQKQYYQELRKFLKSEYETKTIYPKQTDIFNALKYTSFANTKIVILGQDPYINEGEAHGLSFSVQPQSKTPPSLKNIYKEISDDLGCYIPNNGCLVKWTNQGVMLLNTVLTVQAKTSKSHAKKGWEIFTNTIIQKLNEKQTPIIFLLWGKDAASKQMLISNEIHKVLIATHPSPLAGGKFFGCKHFSQSNEFLEQNNMKKIDWQIENV